MDALHCLATQKMNTAWLVEKIYSPLQSKMEPHQTYCFFSVKSEFTYINYRSIYNSPYSSWFYHSPSLFRFKKNMVRLAKATSPASSRERCCWPCWIARASRPGSPSGKGRQPSGGDCYAEILWMIWMIYRYNMDSIQYVIWISCELDCGYVYIYNIYNMDCIVG